MICLSCRLVRIHCQVSSARQIDPVCNKRFCKKIYIYSRLEKIPPPQLLACWGYSSYFSSKKKRQAISNGPFAGALFCCPELGLGGKGKGVNCAEEDGACALDCSHCWVRNQERAPCTFSMMLFNVPQAGTGFVRPDEFWRRCFAIVILADCFFSFFFFKCIHSFKKFLIGFVSLVLCLPPSQWLKNNLFSVRLEIELPSLSILSVSFKLKPPVFIAVVNSGISASGWKLPVFPPRISRDHQWNSTF